MDLITDLSKVFTEGIRKHGSPMFRHTLKNFSGYTVESIYVGRHPIKRAIQYLANIITLGQLEKNRKILNYDDVYHLYMLIKIVKDDKREILKLHKEEVVELSRLDSAMYQALQAPEHQGFTIGLPSPIMFGDFISNSIQLQGESFWTYDAIKNNCQNFILNLLGANGIRLGQAQVKFIKQDAFSLVGKSPILSSILKKITDLGALAHRVRYGTGIIIDVFN